MILGSAVELPACWPSLGAGGQLAGVGSLNLYASTGKGVWSVRARLKSVVVGTRGATSWCQVSCPREGCAVRVKVASGGRLGSTWRSIPKKGVLQRTARAAAKLQP